MGILRRLLHLASKRLHPTPKEDHELCKVPQECRILGAQVESQEKPREEPKRQFQQQDDAFSFEVDWSGMSLGVAFQELILGWMGLPSPFPKPPEQRSVRINRRSGFREPHDALHELYLRRELREGAETGFLVRGVIYDMAALSTRLSPEEVKAALKKRKEKDDRDAKDWSNLLHGSLDDRINTKVEDVSAVEVMERLGLKDSGLREKLAGGGTMVGLLGNVVASPRQKKLEAKQALEEVMGSGDSIRAKYLERLRQKKTMADARREQGRFSVPASFPGMKAEEGMENRCLVATGSPALVRYLQERGVVQALLTRGPKEDSVSLMQQLGNFKFEDVKALEDGGTISHGMLSSLCEKWRLPSKQVVVVVPDDHKPEDLKSAADKGFFVCRVQSERSTPQEPAVRTPTSSEKSGGHEKGLKAWINKLKEGTLHLESEEQKETVKKDPAHFSVLDMTELKWVIEDLNGVSYRPTTFVRGFQ